MYSTTFERERIRAKIVESIERRLLAQCSHSKCAQWMAFVIPIIYPFALTLSLWSPASQFSVLISIETYMHTNMCESLYIVHTFFPCSPPKISYWQHALYQRNNAEPKMKERLQQPQKTQHNTIVAILSKQFMCVYTVRTPVTIIIAQQKHQRIS